MKPRDFEIEDLADALGSPMWETEDFEACPEGDRIWEAASGRLRPAELSRVIDHVGECAVCFHDFRMAREATAEMEERVPTSSRRRHSQALTNGAASFRKLFRRTKNRTTDTLGLLASGSAADGWTAAFRPRANAGTFALLATAAALLLLVPGTSPPRLPDFTSRDSPLQRADASVPSVELGVADGQALSRADFRLHWKGLDDARYDVRVMTTNLEKVAVATDLMDSELRLDEKAFARLRPGTILLWQVSAYLPNGEHRSSLTHRVRIE